MAPESGFGEDGPVGKGEGAALEARDDGVAHVRDQDGHGGDGEEGPDNEEGLSGVAGWTEVAVADGEEGDVAEVEGLKIAEALGVGFCLPESDGSNAPEDTNYQ